VLAGRIDRLPPETKRLLQTAAVIGTEVPLPLLQAIADMPEEVLQRHLAHLQAAEFLYETRLFPEREYTFKHALTHEVAYSSLLQERRRLLHARIIAVLEQQHADRLAEQGERLAHHAFRGEVWDKAVTYLRQAAAKVAARSANREAVAYQEQALVALQHLPESHDTFAQAIDLRIDLRQSLYPLGEFGRILDYLREAETLATALGDEHRLGWISAYMLNHFWLMGNKDRTIEFGQRALAVAEAGADIALQVEVSYRLGQVYWSLSDYRQASACFGRNVVRLEGELIHERFGLPGLPSVLSRAWLVWCLGEQGAFAEGRELGEDVVRLAEALAETIDHPFSLSTAYGGVGHLYLRHGDLDKAISALERGLEVGRHLRLVFPWLASPLDMRMLLPGVSPRPCRCWSRRSSRLPP
jgi:tetratricopeptide (TPR) repeat protein